MRIIKDARNPNRQVREAGTDILNRKENKIIDADTLQAERLAVRIADAYEHFKAEQKEGAKE